jgi:hypothetical protein
MPCASIVKDDHGQSALVAARKNMAHSSKMAKISDDIILSPPKSLGILSKKYANTAFLNA